MLVPLLVVGLSATSAANDPQCWWKLKDGSVPVQAAGIVCEEGQMHYDVAMLTCEGGPLRLLLQSYCNEDHEACSVRMTLDSRSYDLVGESIASGEIWDWIVDVPLQGQREVFQALGRATRFELDIENARTTWIMPIKGLPEAIDTLKASCEANLM